MRGKYRLQNAPTIAPVGTKIGPKSFPGLSDGTQGAPEVSRKRLGASPRRPKGAPGAPRERSRFVWEGPGEPPDTLRDARRRSETVKGDQNRCKVACRLRKLFVKRPRPNFWSNFEFFAKCVKPPKYCACLQKQRFSPLRSESALDV